MLLSLVGFGKSFRGGIDEEHTGDLIPTGVFAVSRNLIYLAFWFVLLGEFLLFPNWIVPVYLAAGSWLQPALRPAVRELLPSGAKVSYK